jgi:hypothetical protein
VGCKHVRLGHRDSETDPTSPVVFPGRVDEYIGGVYPIASDKFGNIWIADEHGDSVTEFVRP